MWAEQNIAEGKSTCAEQQSTITWFSLDSQDNDLSRFWIYLLGALKYSDDTSETHPVDYFDQLVMFLQSGQKPSPDFIDSLINTIEEIGRDYILVLEDYHLIQNMEVHDCLAYLIEHRPPNLRLVIATRIDPPLPLPRLRGRGELSELRAADFRFSNDEVVDYFKLNVGYEMSLQDAVNIDQNIEGWPAGLHMAVLAFQAETTTKSGEEKNLQRLLQFIKNISGKQGFIIDYLAEEVFLNQPDYVREFLLKTSILERMSSPLCTALLEPDWKYEETSSEILAYLKEANLFIIPLDNERKWYRYHHLFADLLKARLNYAEPGLIPVLHNRASCWYEKEKMIGEAVLHAQKAIDMDRAAMLMEEYHDTLIDKGDLATISGWVDTLSGDVIRYRPMLCVFMAWALAFAGKTQRIKELLQYAAVALMEWEAFQSGEGAKPPFELTKTLVLKIKAYALLPQGYAAVIGGQPGNILERAENALAALESSRSKEASYLNWLAGFACRSVGNLDRAEKYQTEAISIGRTMDTAIEVLLFQNELGDIFRLQGKLNSAQEIFRDTLDWVKSKGVSGHGFVSRVEAYLSSVLLEQNNLEEALLHARKALVVLQGWPNHNYMATAYAQYGNVLLATGDLKNAEEYILRAEIERKSAPVDLRVAVPVMAGLMNLWLVKPDWQAAESLAHEIELELLSDNSPGNEINEFREKKMIILARFQLARARLARKVEFFTETNRLLVLLEQSARKTSRVHSLIEIAVLKAIADYLQAGLEPQRESSLYDGAFQSLEEALVAGVTEGYQRIFINEGQVMAEMLMRLLKDKKAEKGDPYPGANEAYIQKLLKSFPPEFVPEKSSSLNSMIEKLTERELEILHMIGQGLSNKEMSQRLYLSEGTVKTHVHNVLGKLGAQSRTQAVARGRELKLL